MLLKLLKTGSYISVALAVVVVGFVGLRGFKRDEGAANLLSSAGAFERYKEKADHFKKAGGDQDSPLVKQAKAFALRINPPEPVQQVERPRVQRGDNQPPRPASRQPLYTKFSLIGTCVNDANPEKSLALIDIPGKGKEWVFQGGEVNRVVIEEISQGKIVYRDGAAKNELFVPAKEGKSLLKVANNTTQTMPSSAQITDAIKERLSRQRPKPSTAVIHPPRTESQAEPAEVFKNALALLKNAEKMQKEKMGIPDSEVNKLSETGKILEEMIANEKDSADSKEPADKNSK